MRTETSSGLPTFLVIGVQKAATSWLWYCLHEHPGIFLPPKREIEYLGGATYCERGWAWWIRRFDGAEAGQIIGDVSVEYVYSPTAPAIIRQKLTNPRIIISLRNPIDRAISAYTWNVRRGKIPNAELNAGLWHALTCMNSYTDATGEIYSDIIRRGFYDEQVSRYLEFFVLDQILFLSFDSIRQSPQAVLKRVYSFVGADPAFVPRSLTRQPKRNTYSDLMIRLERLGHRCRPVSAFLDQINGLIYQAGLARPRPELSFGLQQALMQVYQRHNDALMHVLHSPSEAREARKGIVDDIQSWSQHDT
jgi:hypothetical protein